MRATTDQQRKPRVAAPPPVVQPARNVSQTPPDGAITPDKQGNPVPRPTAAPAVAGATNDGVAKPLWSLRVSRKVPVSISLNSKNAALPEVAAELSKILKVPVMLTPLMQRQQLTQNFEGLPLEGALRLLAPQVYVDYELSGEGSGQPKVVGIYLQDMNEPQPAESTVVKGESEAILIEGNTEDGLDATNEQEQRPLRVTVENNQISVKAHRQPLTSVLYEIASKVNMPFEMKYESTELVDVDFNNYTLEQAVRALSPNLRLYQRTNLNSYEVRPLRLVLVSPASVGEPIAWRRPPATSLVSYASTADFRHVSVSIDIKTSSIT